ncbi:Predicted arabinose efflux permease, MFS family [Kushneria avicenniae]|uniref:Predicted arabinose efflux permease, MFS family n=1 Tax=Kushneria avicenniae TaxID=402385 RepID=A0A1I1JQV2_9GAMM|nr:MFS transporter [Kushneria avicenniae]SFC48243.1 Predicted arabinose efflux permease, MFS family [Kushneria avicenniae]
MRTPLPFRTWLYFGAQSINLTTAVMSVTMAAIVGAEIAGNETLATLPYGFQFLTLMLATYPASRLMSQLGRRSGFLIGNAFLALSGGTGYLAVQGESFVLLTLSHGALGIYIAFANFNRFAATDGLRDSLKSRAMSLVVAGGVLAAIIGPLASAMFRDIPGYSHFALSYSLFIPLAILSSCIAVLLPESTSHAPSAKTTDTERPGRILGQRRVLLAIAVSALGYGIMNLLMIQASLQMHAHAPPFDDVNTAIQWHVLAMFIPSFFTGRLIDRFGHQAMISLGLGLLITTALLNVATQGWFNMTLALIVLGLGWNFTYIGGGALLANTVGDSALAMRLQGINDMAIAVMATLGAFLPAVLQTTIGWQGTNLIASALCIIMLLAVLMVFSRRRHDAFVSGAAGS